MIVYRGYAVARKGPTNFKQHLGIADPALA